MHLIRNLVVAILMTMVTTVMLGIVYPLGITALAQLLFPNEANGQLVERDGRTVGSRLIGQGFTTPGYFRSRPSATAIPYDAAGSGGSQLGPTNRVLVDTVRARVAAAQAGNPGVPVPIDLVTASASGIDPHLSPASARFQVPRVARERGAPASEVLALVEATTEGRTFGLLGEPRVNVLALNLALDTRWPMPR
ncbi:MAG: potassium-transporting ATPase subunit KdpC [Vicinamibacterales bacterium]